MAGIDSYTVLCLHCNGADASNTFTDSSPSRHTITANGDAQIDTAQYKWTSSGLFDGNGDYLAVPHSINWYFDGDATIDWWVRYAALPTPGNSMVVAYQKTDANNLWLLNLYNDSGTYKWQFLLRKGGVNAINMLRDTTLSIDTWYHIEWDHSGTDWYFFQDGTQVGATLSDASTFDDLTGDLYICSDGVGGDASNGWVDEFRISKGIARHTADFTPETVEYSVDLSLTEGVSVSGSFALSGGLSISEGVAINDTFGISVPKAFSEGVEMSDAFALSETKSLTEAIEVSDTYSVSFNQRSLTEAVVVGDGWNINSLNSVRRHRRRIA